MCYAVLTPDLKGSGSKGAEKGGQQRQEKDTIIWSPPKRKRGEGKRPGKDSIKMRYAYICVCVRVVYVRSTVVYRTSRQSPRRRATDCWVIQKQVLGCKRRKRVTLCRHEAYACMLVCTCARYVHNVAAVRTAATPTTTTTCY